MRLIIILPGYPVYRLRARCNNGQLLLTLFFCLVTVFSQTLIILFDYNFEVKTKFKNTVPDF